MNLNLKTIMYSVVLASIISLSAFAGTGENTDDKTLSPYFFIENGDPDLDQMPLKDSKAKVSISGVIAAVKVTQTYKNTGKRPINAQYVFPASTRAAVNGMKMTIGNKVIKAKIKEKKKAKAIYNAAKEEGKNASLLEQQRPNVFSMSVANIMPGQEIKVELDYTELLIPTDGTYEFVYPTVVGPRYTDDMEANEDENNNWVMSPYLQEGEKSETTFAIETTIETGIPLNKFHSPSHKISVDWKSPSQAAVKLDASEKNSNNRDYILRYNLQGKQIQTGVLLYEGKGNDENFFVLMAQPPNRVTSESIPAREYIFVVDVSGSMVGFPLDVTKKLIRNLAKGLRPVDTFNVLLFAGDSEVLFPKSMPATAENLRQAMRVLDGQSGGGSTRLLPALRNAYNMPHGENTSRNILIITDGYISAEKDIFREIDDHLSDANVFAFGIGSGVNRHLVEGIAKTAMGEAFVVTKKAQASHVAGKFKTYIESPVLTGISVDFDGFNAYDVEPKNVPDLFASRPIVMMGKWKGKLGGTIKITGHSGLGEYSQDISLKSLKANESNSALRYLWARKKIERISDYNVGYINADQIEDITALGLRYNLLTKYTSFVAVSEIVVNKKGAAKNVKQPLPLPQGVANSAVGNSMNEGSEPELIAMLLLLAIIGLFIKLKHKQPAQTARAS
jgi:Ca-activated chloride channel homolog